MELRYKQDILGKYIPQYKNKNDEWSSFKESHFPKGGEIYKLIRYIAEVHSSHSWGYAQWYYQDTKEVYFETELTVMAFLGCVKHHFSDNAREVNI